MLKITSASTANLAGEVPTPVPGRMTKTLVKIGSLLVCVSLAHASPLPEYPFVKSEGKAEIWLAPDLGEINFDVVVQDESSAKATAHLEQVSTELLGRFSAHAVVAADIEASDLSKKPVELSTQKGGQIAFAFALKRHFQVHVRDLKQWPEIMDALLARDSIESFSVSFDRTDREQVESKLVAEAGASARKQGNELALAFGRHRGPAMAIAQGGVDRIGAPFGLSTTSVHDKRSPTPPVPGSISDTVPVVIPFAQSVHAIFKLTAK